MEELLKKFENKLKALTNRCEELEQANLRLKQNLSMLQREKETLLSKNRIAITQIENMVSRLKSIEQSHNE